MPLVRRLRLPALFCALAVLVCELIARPYANMGICDDWSYAHTAQMLAATGHLVYSGWTPSIQLWQAYLGAAFIKLFGDSFTTLRMSTLLVAMAVAFLLQRTLVRAGITERNATIGTLALVVSPLYLMLSVTFMNDITGLFGMLICLYGCLRALQSVTPRATIGWLCFAVATNAIFGSSRQIAWLGILVMVPSTLWLLRARRRVFLAGAAANLAGVLFIFACLQWLKHQPYTVPEHLLLSRFPLSHTIFEVIYAALDVPFLLLPVVALFIPQIRKSRPRVIAIFCISLAAYLSLSALQHHGHVLFPLEPAQRDWINVHGIFDGVVLPGSPPIFLHKNVQILLTVVSFSGVFGLIAALRGNRLPVPAAASSASISWQQLGILFVPFTLVYVLLLIPSSANFYLFDRYLLPLLLIATLCLFRCYQDRVQPQVPIASTVLVAIMAIYGIAVTHNMFAFYRARIALAAELRAHGIPDTSVDNGWEYNLNVELQHSNYINDARIVVPANAYVPTPPPPAGPCQMLWYDETPHIHPLYSASFDPNACYGPAPFAPVHYSRWPASIPGTLYVVRYARDAKP